MCRHEEAKPVSDGLSILLRSGNSDNTSQLTQSCSTDLFKCGQDEKSCTCHNLYTQSAALQKMQGTSATSQNYSPALFFSNDGLALKSFHSCKNQKRLVPAKDVAKAPCTGEAMYICVIQQLVLFCQHLWVLVSYFCFLQQSPNIQGPQAAQQAQVSAWQAATPWA